MIFVVRANSIKIAYYTENEIPDFNCADYAIGQAHINYLDRYLRIPYLFGLSFNYANSKMFYLRKLVINKKRREKFCVAVISNHRSYSRFRLTNWINIKKLIWEENIIIMLEK